MESKTLFAVLFFYQRLCMSPIDARKRDATTSFVVKNPVINKYLFVLLLGTQ